MLEIGAKQVGRAVRLKRDHMKAESMKCENRFAKGRDGPAAAALHKLALCVCSVIQCGQERGQMADPQSDISFSSPYYIV